MSPSPAPPPPPTPPSPAGTDLIALIRPRPETRHLVMGSTGSGKSTLNGVLLEAYHTRHPEHLIVLLDPKRRFFARRSSTEDRRLFPAGVMPSIHRLHGLRRRGVQVNGRLLAGADGYRFRGETVYVIQDLSKIREFLLWIYHHADIRRPVLIYADEVLDFLGGNGRADQDLRRIIQQGRELGIGMLLTTQRLVWVDSTFLSEFERLYIGILHARSDRLKLAQNVHLPDAERLMEPVGMYEFELVDQVRGQARRFRLVL